MRVGILMRSDADGWSQRLAGLLVAAGMALTTAAGGQVAAPDAVGRLVWDTVNAPSLQANALGDPAAQPVAVYLPPGYSTRPEARFPTLYLLHGYLGRPEEWTAGYQRMQLPAVMDSLIGAAATGDVIVVVPNGRNAYFGSFYANSATGGNWEDFIVADVVGHVDRTYRTLPRAASRGIAGHSMGGYGAIMLGMTHPDVFGALYALSPCCVDWLDDMGPGNAAWAPALAVRDRSELVAEPRSLQDFYVSAFLAMGAAFSGNPANPPLFLDLPFVRQGGRLVPREPAFARWSERFPVAIARSHLTNPRSLRGIFLDYGELEEFSHIRSATARFSSLLAELGVPHRFEVYSGGTHNNLIRRRFESRVVPFFGQVLEFGER
jgi:S-formylglutathione hydrolase FrmB